MMLVKGAPGVHNMISCTSTKNYVEPGPSLQHKHILIMNQYELCKSFSAVKKLIFCNAAHWPHITYTNSL